MGIAMQHDGGALPDAKGRNRHEGPRYLPIVLRRALPGRAAQSTALHLGEGEQYSGDLGSQGNLHRLGEGAGSLRGLSRSGTFNAALEALLHPKILFLAGPESSL